MTMKTYYFLVVALFCSSTDFKMQKIQSSEFLDASIVSQDDKCGDILKYGIYDESSTKKDHAKAVYFVNRFILDDYQKFQDVQNKEANATIPIKKVMVGLGYKESEGEFREFKKYIESYNSLSDTESDKLDQVVKTINPNIVRAWNECMTQDGPYAYIEFTEDPEVFNLRYKCVGSQNIRITNAVIDKPKAVIIREGKIFNSLGKKLPNAQISANLQTQTFIRKTHDALTIVIDVEHGKIPSLRLAALPPRLKTSVEYGEWKLLPSDGSKTVLNDREYVWRHRVTFFPRLIITNPKEIKHIKITREYKGTKSEATIEIDEYIKMNKDDEYAFHNWPKEFKLDRSIDYKGNPNHKVLAKAENEKLIEERKKMEAETQYTFVYKLQNGREITVRTMPGMR